MHFILIQNINFLLHPIQYMLGIYFNIFIYLFTHFLHYTFQYLLVFQFRTIIIMVSSKENVFYHNNVHEQIDINPFQYL